MSRWLTVVFAAFEALIVLAIGLAIPLAVSSVVWALHLGFGPDWVVIWRAAADIWLLGHGVDLTFRLDPATVAMLAMAGADRPVLISMALLGFALLTAGLAVRAGRRIAEVGHPIVGAGAEALTFAAGSTAVVLLSLDDAARAPIWQGVLLPTLAFTVGLLIGVGSVLLRPQRYVDIPDRYAKASRRLLDRIPERVRVGVSGVLRGAAGSVLGLVAVGSVVTAGAMVVGFGQIIALYESLHTGVLGGIVLTIAQLTILPNLLIWVIAWLVGPGFVLGAGTSLGPFGASLGPLPPVPMLGAIPADPGAAGWLVLLLPILVGFTIGMLLYPRIRHVVRDWWSVLVGLAAGAVAGLLLGLLAAASAGAAGPGRFVEVGPDPVAVGVWGGIELAVSITAGLLASASLPAMRRGPLAPLRTDPDHGD